MTKYLEQIASELKSIYKYDPYSGNFYLKLSWEPKEEGENQMTKSIEEAEKIKQKQSYLNWLYPPHMMLNKSDCDKASWDSCERRLDFQSHKIGWADGAKARDAQWLEVVNELREALELVTEIDNTYDSKTWDVADKAILKADQLLREMGIKI